MQNEGLRPQDLSPATHLPEKKLLDKSKVEQISVK